eukprot:gene5902-8142_t
MTEQEKIISNSFSRDASLVLYSTEGKFCMTRCWSNSFSNTSSGKYVQQSTKTENYSLNKRSLHKILVEENLGGMKVIEIIEESSLLVLVSSGDKPGTSPRKLKIWNIQTKSVIYEVSFDSTIKSCRSNDRYLAVATEFNIELLDLQTMTIVHTITPFPQFKSFALSFPNADKDSNSGEEILNIPFIVYPSMKKSGSLAITNCDSHKIINEISVHKSDVDIININSSNTLLATSSITGTLIRIFSLPAGDHLLSFRNSSFPTRIHCISFCNYSRYLLSGSINGTVNIFQIPYDNREQKNNLNHVVEMNDNSTEYDQSNKQKSNSKDNDFITVSEEDEEGYCNVDNTDANNHNKRSISQDSNQSNISFKPLLDNNYVSTIFSIADRTANVGFQTVQNISSTLFPQNRSDPRYGSGSDNSTSKSIYHQDIRFPIFNAKVPNDESHFNAIFKYHDEIISSPSANNSEKVYSNSNLTTQQKLSVLLVTEKGYLYRFRSPTGLYIPNKQDFLNNPVISSTVQFLSLAIPQSYSPHTSNDLTQYLEDEFYLFEN